ncbi:hypothetical protein Tco_0686147 [Tanacetum coccineum]
MYRCDRCPQTFLSKNQARDHVLLCVLLNVVAVNNVIHQDDAVIQEVDAAPDEVKPIDDGVVVVAEMIEKVAAGQPVVVWLEKIDDMVVAAAADVI